MNTVYLDGAYVPAETATISIDDRGFLFADACYEVTAVHHGRCIALDRHLARLQRGLDQLRIRYDASRLEPVHRQLIERNDLDVGSVYVHVTRGVAPRDHAFPLAATPTVLVRTRVSTRPLHEPLGRAITVPDVRWARVDIKTTGLLANVLAQQDAVDVGATDVILHRSGVVTEGSHTNVYGVIGGVVITAPADHRILAGVTRSIVLELARAAGIDVVEREWSVDELLAADELIMTSTTSGVRPIVEVDACPIGSGMPGPVTQALQRHYDDLVAG